VATLRRLLALGAAAALLAGCGSYTKADFAASANALCANAVRESRALPPPSFAAGAAGLSALASYLHRLLPIVGRETRQMLALRRPTGKASSRRALSRYLAAVSQAFSDYSALAAAARRGDTEGVTEAEARLRASPVASLAARYGLRSCANPGATVS
jgi:hypothetical protein